MNADDDVFTGEYFVSLKNYKIPLKSAHFDVNNPPPPGTEDEMPISNEIDSYVSPLAMVKRPNLLTEPPPPPPPTPPTSANPIQEITKSALAQANSPSKSTKRSSLFMMPSAEGLPEELVKLFKPLCCDLCSAKLNSPATARLHYESRNHEKKINHWLAGWSERTGEPLPKRQAINRGPTGKNALHCDVCDLALTSLQHAKQHNMGKKHKNALAGKNKPGGTGYYDANNKWIRTPKPEEDPTNRFFIGESFLIKKENEIETVVVPESVLKSPPPPPPPPETFPEIENEINPAKVGKRSKNAFDIAPDDLMDVPISAAPQSLPSKSLEPQLLDETAHLQSLNAPAIELSKYCKLCDITVTADMHMRLHLAGAKHAKKLRQLGEPPYAEVPHTLSQCILEETKTKTKPIHVNTTPNTISTTDGGVTVLDYSVFRTPSGHYYCQVCDLSVTSEVTLAQHFASKRHMKSIKRK